MTYYCEVCGKTIKSSSKYIHFKSKTHSSFKNSIIRRYIFLNPNFDGFDKLLRKYFISYKQNYEEYDVRYLFKLLTTANHVRYTRINPQSSLYYSIYAHKKSIISKPKKVQYYFIR